MTQCNLHFAIPLALVVALAPVAADAQSIDQALELYDAGDLPEAAMAFYDVLVNDADPDRRDQAAIYLAETLRKMDLFVPAWWYYKYVFEAGRDNRYYLNAIEGLLKLQKAMHDWALVPGLINAGFDSQGFAQLDPQSAAHVNYLIGELSYRKGKVQDAKLFLEYVPPESPYHAKARYLLGLLEVNVGAYDGALDHFRRIVDIVPEDAGDDEQLRVRNLALLASARAAYGLQRYDLATELYKKVPRLSDAWFSAIYENAWSHFLQDEYGKALGEAQSARSPYFAKHHVPDAYVVAATTYFASCQWDRVRREVSAFKRIYEPMLQSLTRYLGESRDMAKYYHDVVSGGGGRFSIEIAREVRRLRRFKDYHYLITHMGWELDTIGSQSLWKGSRLADDLATVVGQRLDAMRSAVGKWVKGRLGYQEVVLKDLQTQISYIDFEVTDAETKWLEQGKEILKGRRARMPRPDIPNDQWQHWNFDREYWKDELGYIQHSLASECLEDLVD